MGGSTELLWGDVIQELGDLDSCVIDLVQVYNLPTRKFTVDEQRGEGASIHTAHRVTFYSSSAYYVVKRAMKTSRPDFFQ